MSASDILSLAVLGERVRGLLIREGVAPENAATLAEVIVAAERDGSFSHGVSRLPGYIATLRSGWVDARCAPKIADVAPGLVRVDANNGFSQIALREALPLLERKVRAVGIACLSIFNCHHFAALWTDIEPLAEKGLLALNFVNSRCRIGMWGSAGKVLGTNPMAFACPRVGAPPLVWDQASSVRSQGDVLIAARSGKPMPLGVGVDKDGTDTTDATAILDGGALLPYGGHKGGSIALMVEIMAAALSGGNFGFEDRASDFPGAVTCNTGQTILVIDPARMVSVDFGARVEQLFGFFGTSGIERLPGDARRARRQLSVREGVVVSEPALSLLLDPDETSAT